VTRQLIYGMPTGSVIVRFGLSYPRIFIISGANFMFIPKYFVEVTTQKKKQTVCFDLLSFFCNLVRFLGFSLYKGSLGN